MYPPCTSFDAVFVVFICFFVVLVAAQTSTSTPDLLNTRLFQKLEEDCLEFARQVEEAYEFNNRCDASILQTCDRSNHDECNTIFPNLTCQNKGHDLETLVCAEAGQCMTSGFDTSQSVIRLPPYVTLTEDGNPDPSNTEVIETICFTQQLDPWFQEKRDEDLEFYQGYGIDPPQMHYGDRNGVFRLYPARHSDICHEYDPTIRPWFVAGSSGPKNLVLVLDTSGSMARDCSTCLSSMQEAAKRVVNSLSVGDYVAIVTFNSDATLHADPETGFLYRATKSNKEQLVQAIDNLTAVGGTNFYDPLEMAFDALDRTIENEVAANCNSAILFLTDGRVSSGGDVGDTTGLSSEDVTLLREDAVLDLVQQRMANSTHKSQIHGALTNQVLFFSYSIDGADSELHEFPKRLACDATEVGVWSKVVRPDQIIDSLSSYYLLFSSGLADGKNSNFTTWVEPYKFASTQITGTTISSPVFDRSVDPPVFLGVVGIDLPMSAINRALGVSSEAGTNDLPTEEIFKAASFKCPALELSPCLMESFRMVSGEESMCERNNFTSCDLVRVTTTMCPHAMDYTAHPLVDAIHQGLPSDMDRLCCEIPPDICMEETSPTASPTASSSGSNTGNKNDTVAKNTDQQSKNDRNTNMIIWVTIAVLVPLVVLVLVVLWVMAIRRRRPSTMPRRRRPSTNAAPVPCVNAIPVLPQEEAAPESSLSLNATGDENVTGAENGRMTRRPQASTGASAKKELALSDTEG